jgi:hypothetical protein
MMFGGRSFAACLIALGAIAFLQQAAAIPSVALSEIRLSYPPVAEAARVSGE